MKKKIYLYGLLMLSLLLSCRQEPRRSAELLASTSIVADVVRQVAGPSHTVTELIPPGASVHQFEPTPHQIILLHQAGLIFLNGAGLETRLIKAAVSQVDSTHLVDLSTGLDFRTHPDLHGQSSHDHSRIDPHIWTDPNLVKEWLPVMTRRLSAAYPEDSLIFQQNARIFADTLTALDQWIREQVGQIPVQRRILLTDHRSLGYFADRYGFSQVGALIPSFSDLAEPTARDLARLQDQASQLKVPAVFVDRLQNKALARQFATDSGLRLVPLLMGSLAVDAATYPDFIRYNVSRICTALQE
jgi:ABC-type Zn uptake system ZnuABC Zn-binding protein ZnuA